MEEKNYDDDLLYLLLRRGYQEEGEIHHLSSASAAAWT